jgi:hypothetical protein
VASLKYIYRQESQGFHAWAVKMKRAKRMHVRYFKDGAEGPIESLRRAIAYRDALFKRLPAPMRIFSSHVRNTTGIIGVNREVSRTSSGNLAENWVGKWVEADGWTIRRRAFSVNKYGEEAAKAMAIAAREENVARVL